MTSDFILYGSPHSQFTYKVALMLRLSGHPFAFRYVSFQRGIIEPRSSWLFQGGDKSRYWFTRSAV